MTASPEPIGAIGGINPEILRWHAIQTGSTTKPKKHHDSDDAEGPAVYVALVVVVLIIMVAIWNIVRK